MPLPKFLGAITASLPSAVAAVGLLVRLSTSEPLSLITPLCLVLAAWLHSSRASSTSKLALLLAAFGAACASVPLFTIGNPLFGLLVLPPILLCRKPCNSSFFADFVALIAVSLAHLIDHLDFAYAPHCAVGCAALLLVHSLWPSRVCVESFPIEPNYKRPPQCPVCLGFSVKCLCPATVDEAFFNDAWNAEPSRMSASAPSLRPSLSSNSSAIKREKRRISFSSTKEVIDLPDIYGEDSATPRPGEKLPLRSRTVPLSPELPDIPVIKRPSCDVPPVSRSIDTLIKNFDSSLSSSGSKNIFDELTDSSEDPDNDKDDKPDLPENDIVVLSDSVPNLIDEQPPDFTTLEDGATEPLDEPLPNSDAKSISANPAESKDPADSMIKVEMPTAEQNLAPKVDTPDLPEAFQAERFYNQVD